MLEFNSASVAPWHLHSRTLPGKTLAFPPTPGHIGA
jgi:hypothetical protein